MAELVSILIPCFNAERWLAQTVESTLAQTWPNTEVIVVDDGSTDGSLDIARSFESQGVTVITQENRGACVARNRALEAASGDYIQYLDADDLLSTDKIERQVCLLQQHPPGYLAVCDTIHFFDSEDTEVMESGWPRVDTDDPLNWLIDLLGPEGRGGMVHPGAWLTPRAVAEKAGPWNENLTLDQDGEYFARVVLASAGLRRAGEGHSYYRKYRDRSSISGRCSRQAHLSALQSIDSKADLIFGRVDEANEARARRALARHYERRAFLAYPDHSDITEAAEREAQALGGGHFEPLQHSRKARLMGRLFGWKAGRRLQKWYRSLLKLAPS